MSEKETSIAKNEHESTHEDLDAASQEQREALRDKLEKAEQEHHEGQSEREAVEKASELAKEAEEKSDSSSTTSPAERRRGPISKKQLNASFETEMKHARREMNITDRLVSKFIHIKPVEKASDIIGSTIARPNAMLSGSIVAFIAITTLYFVSKYYGYPLSGFETIATFIFGWAIGILYDYFSVMIKGNKH